MMPGMNGFEVLEEFRNNINTSHIPFILLTAKNDDESGVLVPKCGVLFWSWWLHGPNANTVNVDLEPYIYPPHPI